MKICIVGLGSMGKRRIRCLLALGYTSSQIIGVDQRADRRQEASITYGITVFSNFSDVAAGRKPDRLIISVPPDVHHIYMKEAVRLGIHFFVEASVVDTDMEQLIEDVRNAGIVAAPSSTLYFHPGIQIIQQVLREGTLGSVSSVLHHSGQYLPDWHTYESVSDYYVSNPKTGGAREIVPFELTWINAIWGYPQRVTGMHRKTINISGAEQIDDTYICLLDYEKFLMNITVDVVSLCATRRLLINGEKAQLRWDWDENKIRIYHSSCKSWEDIQYFAGPAQAGYNSNIGEIMYIEELRAFLSAADGGDPFINTLERDHLVLQTLYALESAEKESRIVTLPFAGKNE